MQLEPVPNTAIMGYSDIDTLAVNTIRVLAVSCCPSFPSTKKREPRPRQNGSVSAPPPHRGRRESTAQPSQGKELRASINGNSKMNIY